MNLQPEFVEDDVFECDAPQLREFKGGEEEREAAVGAGAVIEWRHLTVDRVGYVVIQTNPLEAELF